MSNLPLLARYTILFALAASFLDAYPKPATLFQAPTVSLPGPPWEFTPNQIGKGDFNHDGNLDLAVCLGKTVGVLVGGHSGQFAAPVTYPAGGYALSLAVADFNHDGNLDVAVLTQTASWEVELFLGKGDGTLLPYSVAITGLSFPLGLVVADFNRDGKADLATVNGSGLTVFLGKGTGKFHTGTNLPAPITCSMSDITVASLKVNASPSLMAVCYANNIPPYVAIFPGNGDGTFQSTIIIPLQVIPWGAVLGDLNKDGNADLILATTPTTGQTPALTTVMLGNGDGTFGPGTSYPAPSYASASIVADANNDGKLDVIVLNRFGVTSVYLGNGDGTLQPEIDYDTGAAPVSIVAGDFNRDGRTDLAVFNAFELTLLFGKPNGRLDAPTSFNALNRDAMLVAADFNGDGILDIATSAASVLFGKGDGTFQPAVPLDVGPNVPTVVLSADLNRDGAPDLIFAHALYGVNILLNNGNGTFRKGQTIGNSSAGIAIADFNGDGIPDILSTYVPTNYQARGILTLLLGNGDGTFRPLKPFANNLYGYLNLRAADLNGDGKMDFVANYGGGGIGSGFTVYFAGNGDGTFQPPVKVARAGSDLSIVDANGDGKLDLVILVVNGPSPTIETSLGNGDGTFQSPLISEGPPGPVNSPSALTVADLNGDGILDVATTDSQPSYPGGDVRVGYGNGDGTFTFSPQIYLAGDSPLSIVSGNFSGGLHPDLAIANAGGSSVWVLRNITPP